MLSGKSHNNIVVDVLNRRAPTLLRSTTACQTLSSVFPTDGHAANKLTAAFSGASHNHNGWPPVVFAVIAFFGHGAEILRREAADSGNDIRHVVQCAVETDIADSLSHFNVATHAIRVISGAPATQLVLLQKMDTETLANRGGGSGAALYCAVAVRARDYLAAATIGVSLRSTCNNPSSFRTVMRLMARVCCAKPTRVLGDAKARTPFDPVHAGGFHCHIVRLEEISQQASLQPRWFADLFTARPTHIVNSGTVSLHVADEPPHQLLSNQLRAMTLKHQMQLGRGGGGGRDERHSIRDQDEQKRERGPVHVVYRSPQRGESVSNHAYEHAESIGRADDDDVEDDCYASSSYRQRPDNQRFNSSVITVANASDASWIPVSVWRKQQEQLLAQQQQQQQQQQSPHNSFANSRSVGVDPIVLQVL